MGNPGTCCVRSCAIGEQLLVVGPTNFENKRCRRCGVVKSVTEFHKSSGSKDGLHSYCKECSKETVRLSRSKDPERARQYSRDYRQKNLDHVRNRERVWCENNRESRAASQKRWIANNPETKRENTRRVMSRRRARLKGLPTERYQKSDVASRDGAHCWMCGAEVSEYDRNHVDHLIPIAASLEQLDALGVSNPGDVLANVSFTCSPCGSRKNNRVMLCAVARFLRNSTMNCFDTE